MRPWLLSEVTFDHIRSFSYEVAVLPLGATEPHNLHLPYGTDTFEAECVGERLCRRAFEQGARVILLPAIPYGTETNMRQLPFAMNVMPSTLFRLLRDLVDSLVQTGIRKIVLLNSHGGNDLKPFLREMYGATPAHLFLIDWFRVLADVAAEIFDEPDDHAGEMETSLMLAHRPDLVARDDAGRLRADEGAPRQARFPAIENKWVSITRPWHLLTTATGCGNPHAATAEKGEAFLARLEERLVPFLVALSSDELDATFPY